MDRPADSSERSDPDHPALPMVSVVIPARNATATIGRAVRSALDQKYPRLVEVVVAAADTDTAGAVPADPRVIIVDNPAGTTPTGLNLAIARATGAVVVRCDAHSVLPPGYVELAVEILRTTGADNVGGLQVPVGETFFERAVAVAMQSPIGSGDARYRIGGDAGPVDTVFLGTFMREALESLGGFDESMIRNQDYDLNYRIRSSGGTVWFDPRLAVQYRPRGTLAALWRQYSDYGRGKRAMLRRHPGSLRWRQTAAPLLVIGLLSGAGLGLAGFGIGWWAPGTYAAATVVGSAVDGIRRRDPSAVAEPLALWTMHIGWGTGFLSPRRTVAT